ncbi:MAG: hypothetical protein K6E20_02675 [Acholeplasmatales bacterium]|nr:hypothetical protein [Acholeplasmatales bacterium]
MKTFRKLILASSTALATALTLTSTTWAWFKINSTATVENFDFQVVGGNGFLVSIDGKNYYNDLSNEQMLKVIARDYGNGTYEIHPYKNYGKDDQTEQADTFYKISYDENMNKVYTELSGEDLTKELNKVMNDKIQIWPVTTTNGRDFTTLSSNDGYHSPSSGYYAQFSVYFKPESDNEMDKLKYDVYMTGYSGKNTAGDTILPTLLTSEVRKIKLHAGLTTSENGVIKTYNSDEIIQVYTSNSTRISSTVSNLTTVEAGYSETTDAKFIEGKQYYLFVDGQYVIQEVTAGEEIGTTDIYYEYHDETQVYTTDEASSLIYEINDTTNGSKNLGSYATDYINYGVTSDTAYVDGKDYFVYDYKEFTGTEFVSGVSYYVSDGTTYTVTEDSEPVSGKQYYTYELTRFEGTTFSDGVIYYEYDYDSNYYMYNSDVNAMFTYYNKLVSAERRLKALSYNNLPTNIINQLPAKDSERLEKVENASDADADHYKEMVTLQSGDAAKYITFRIWLEGWDADNIDGLANPVDVRLSFASKRVYD